MSEENKIDNNQQEETPKGLEENISSSDSVIPSTNNNQQTEKQNMEVHHHAHAHGKKNWKSYFWEFLMLFLAVFCGFLAEYQLEHVIEHQREEDYIVSMIDDLAKDTSNLNLVIENFKANKYRLNKLLIGFDNNRENASVDWATDFIISVKEGYADFITQTVHSSNLKIQAVFVSSVIKKQPRVLWTMTQL